MKTGLMRLMTLLVLLLLAFGAWAQEEDIASGFKKLDAAEEQRLRAVLAQPVPERVESAKTLNAHFTQKADAAHRLNDEKTRESILRQWVEALPDAWSPRDRLAFLLHDSGQFDEAIRFRFQAIALVAYPPSKAHLLSALSEDLMVAGRSDEAQKAIDSARQYIVETERKSWNDSAMISVFLARFRMESTQSALHERFGRWDAAVVSANEAETNARQRLKYAQRISGSAGERQRYYASNDLTYALSRKIGALRMAGRFSAADLAIQDIIRLSREVELRPRILATTYEKAARLRMSQREFVQAENYARKAVQGLTTLGYEALHPWNVSASRALVNALEGQLRWSDTAAELDRLDTLTKGDSRLLAKVRFHLERGLAYVHTGKSDQAVKLFDSVAADRVKRYGAHHFFVAEARGLQGVALWRVATPESKTQAIALLKESARDYTAVANADYLENIGIRKETRELIFATYIEALATTPGEDATQAIGAADWVRTSIVQESLSDAAARAAASTPALADVVRREQDAKNEVAGIRRYLSGETGGVSSPLPQIAAQMRERIAVLEADRVKLQAEIKAKFPDYDHLVRPTPPTVQQVASRLEPQQALLMLLPTTDAVYVWAVASDRPPAFIRAKLTEPQVNTLVTRLRSQLDFGANAKAGQQFDSAAAFELYDKLLAPLAGVWSGKTQLIVAAGGRLSQLPFGVLQTRAGGGNKADAPWLIKQASIAQVPSLSAWTAIKAIATGKSATQAFIGWGDPEFKENSAVVPVVNARAAIKNETFKNTNTRTVNLTRASTLLDLEALEATSKVPSALNYADIPALPETRDELLAIAKELGAKPGTDLLLGSQATRASVLSANQSGLLANKRVLAFATHGLMAGDLPNLTQPALALAATGSDAQNPLAPLLTLEDVLTLKLNADWVVLSACNTAAADGKAEEALSGLARGFFYAGSRSLLVTHWAVESESAKQLTTHTFAHYAANPQAPKAESLRQAMLKVMAQPQYSHPAYWAPYALVGDGGR
jgi:CHAT domain-containing protein